MKNKIITSLIALIIITLGTLQVLQIQKKNNEKLKMKLYPVKMTNLYGYINNDNDVIIKPKFRKALHFYDDIALVEKCRKDQCVTLQINKLGQQINKDRLDFDFNNLKDFNLIKVNHRYGYTDKYGKIVIEPKYDLATEFSDGLAAVAKYNYQGADEYLVWEYIDTQGKKVFEYQFVEANPFIDGVALIKTLLGYNVIDKSGKYLCKNFFQSCIRASMDSKKIITKYENATIGFYPSVNAIKMDFNCKYITTIDTDEDNIKPKNIFKIEPYKYEKIHTEIENDKRTKYLNNFKNDYSSIIWIQDNQEKAGYINIKKEIGYFDENDKFIKTFQY